MSTVMLMEFPILPLDRGRKEERPSLPDVLLLVSLPRPSDAHALGKCYSTNEAKG